MSLKYRCQVCEAKPGQECRNTVKPGEPLPGRRFHLVRSCPSVWVRSSLSGGAA